MKTILAKIHAKWFWRLAYKFNSKEVWIVADGQSLALADVKVFTDFTLAAEYAQQLEEAIIVPSEIHGRVTGADEVFGVELRNECKKENEKKLEGELLNSREGE